MSNGNRTVIVPRYSLLFLSRECEDEDTSGSAAITDFFTGKSLTIFSLFLYRLIGSKKRVRTSYFVKRKIARLTSFDMLE
jgi:hypothetical protein